MAEALQKETSQISRRNLLKQLGALSGYTAVAAGGFDRFAGSVHELSMNAPPEAEVHINPDKERTVIVADGLGGDGILAGRTMLESIGEIGSIVGVRYAPTAIEPKPLQELIMAQLKMHNLNSRRVSAYLNSAAAVFMVEPLRRMAEEDGVNYDVIVMDSSPTGVNDVLNHQRWLIELARLGMGYHRSVNFLARHAIDLDLPAVNAEHHSVSTPPHAVEARRQAILETDTITLAAQARYLQDSAPQPGSMSQVPGHVVYLRAARDSIVDTDSAITGWEQIYGRDIDLFEDLHFRPESSHAAGPLWPAGVTAALRRGLPLSMM